VFARPSFTPTIPNAWPVGKDPPHCGHEMSLPVVEVVPGGGLTCEAATTGDALVVANAIAKAAQTRTDRARVLAGPELGEPAEAVSDERGRTVIATSGYW
jgi:hypothetical protein